MIRSFATRHSSIVATLFVLWFFACFLPPTSLAQFAVSTGTPPFGSFTGGPDIINLGNNNAHWDIQVLARAGRATNFTYDLVYDSSVWYPVTSGGTTTWTPVGNWGWSSISQPVAGYLTFSDTQSTKDKGLCTISTFTNYTFHDSFGSAHRFPGSYVLEVWNGIDGQNVNCFSSGALNSQTTDGSGLKLTATGIHSTLTFPNGTTEAPPYNPTLPVTVTDRNGNQSSVAYSSGAYTFTDTLGTAALTVGGSGTPTSPDTFTYTPPNTASSTCSATNTSGVACYAMSFVAYTVATNFATGTNEYGAHAINLVDKITLPDGSFYQFAYEATPSTPSSGACTPLSGTYQANCVTARLASVTLPTGGQIKYTYSGGAGTNNSGIFSDGSTATLQRQTPDGTWTYARTQVSGTEWQTLVTDPSSAQNQTLIYFQKDSATSPVTNNFYETRRQVYQGSTSDTLLRQWTTCYNGNASTCTLTTPVSSPITQRNVTDQYGTSGLQCQHSYFYNTIGGLSEQDDYDYGPSGQGGSLLRKLLITYAPLGNNITAFKQTITICNGTGSSSGCFGPSGGIGGMGIGTVASKTTYNYDEGTVTAPANQPTPQHTSVTGSRGNLTSINYPVSGLTSHFTYYDTGNLNVATDVNGGATTYTYGALSATCGNSFPTGITEAISTLTQSYVWNCTGGVMTSLTDENSQVSSTTYNDPYFWRPNGVTDQLSNQTSIGYSMSAGNEVGFYTSLLFNSNNSVANTGYGHDGLGRLVQISDIQSPTATTWDQAVQSYDSNGRLGRIYMPCTTTGPWTCNTPYTSYSYDALNRPLVITDGGGGTITYSYPQNDVLVTVGPPPTGENTKQRQLEYDALGRLTSVCEITTATGSGTCGQSVSQTGYWTKYTYDALGNLLNVTQNAQSGSQQTRTYAYDAMSRLTSEANPESGTTTYFYDSDGTCGTFSGNLVRRVDANGNVTCYHYDQLRRATSITYPSGPNAAATSPKTFLYDTTSFSCPTGANVKARLAEAYTGPSAAKITDLAYCYSPRAEVTDIYTATQSFGGYNHITKSYWANGVLKLLSGVPGLPTIYYGATDGSGLDGEGRITKVIAASGPNPINCSTPPCVSYNSAGQVTNLIFGSGDSDSYSYDPNTGRMNQYQFTVNGQSAVGTPSWNANGTLASLNVTDPFNSLATQNCTYAHDDLSRLGSVNCPNAWSQTFTYDPFGNITKTGSYWWPPSGSGYSAATNRYTLPGAQYDNNGNLLNDTFHTYQWDAEGKIVAVDVGGSNYTDYLTYDAFENMAEYKQTYPNGPPWLAQQVFGVLGSAGTPLGYTTSSGGTNFELPLVGGAKMAGWSGTTVYGHADWLGGIRLDSTPSRTVTSDVVFAPFGEVYNSPTTYWWEFAGLAQRLTNDVWTADARQYHAKQGRWLSPDPAGLAAVAPSNPQSWNRYSYVLNNPLSWVDPSGMYTVCVGGYTYDKVDFYVDGQYQGSDYTFIGDSCGGRGPNLSFPGGGGGGSSDMSNRPPFLPSTPPCTPPTSKIPTTIGITAGGTVARNVNGTTYTGSSSTTLVASTSGAVGVLANVGAQNLPSSAPPGNPTANGQFAGAGYQLVLSNLQPSQLATPSTSYQISVNAVVVGGTVAYSSYPNGGYKIGFTPWPGLPFAFGLGFFAKANVPQNTMGLTTGCHN